MGAIQQQHGARAGVVLMQAPPFVQALRLPARAVQQAGRPGARLRPIARLIETTRLQKGIQRLNIFPPALAQIAPDALLVGGGQATFFYQIRLRAVIARYQNHLYPVFGERR